MPPSWTVVTGSPWSFTCSLLTAVSGTVNVIPYIDRLLPEGAVCLIPLDGRSGVTESSDAGRHSGTVGDAVAFGDLTSDGVAE